MNTVGRSIASSDGSAAALSLPASPLAQELCVPPDCHRRRGVPMLIGDPVQSHGLGRRRRRKVALSTLGFKVAACGMVLLLHGSPALADDLTQEIGVDHDNDPATPEYKIKVTADAKTQANTLVGALNAIKVSASLRLLVARAALLHPFGFTVMDKRDTTATALGSTAPGIIFVDTLDFETVANSPNTHLTGALPEDRSAIAQQMLKETLAHEIAHMAYPEKGMQHDDVPGSVGIINLGNDVMQDLGLLTRMQDADCSNDRSMGWHNGVELKLATPRSAGGWNAIGVCRGQPQPDPVPAASAPALLALTVGLLAVGTRLQRRRSSEANRV